MRKELRAEETPASTEILLADLHDKKHGRQPRSALGEETQKEAQVKKHNLSKLVCRDCSTDDQAKFRRSYRDICVDCWRTRKRTNNPDWRERQRAVDSKPNNRFSRGRAQARSRDCPWEITLEFFKELIAKPCEYCEGPLDPTGIAMDRIEHELGYTPENVVPACCICNDMRARVFTYEEMRRIGQVIKQIRAERVAAGIPQPKTSAYFYRLRKMEVREKARASVEA